MSTALTLGPAIGAQGDTAATDALWRVKAREEGCATFSAFFEGELTVADALTPQQLFTKIQGKWPTARLHIALDYYKAMWRPGDRSLHEHPWARHFTRTNAYVIDIDSGDLEIQVFSGSLCKILGIPLQ